MVRSYSLWLFLIGLAIPGSLFADPIAYECETREFAVKGKDYQDSLGKKKVVLDWGKAKVRTRLSVEKRGENPIGFSVDAEVRAIRPEDGGDNPKFPKQALGVTVKTGEFSQVAFNVIEGEPIHLSLMSVGQYYYIYCDPKE